MINTRQVNGTNDRKQGQEIQENKETQEGQGKNKEQRVHNPDTYIL